MYANHWHAHPSSCGQQSSDYSTFSGSGGFANHGLQSNPISRSSSITTVSSHHYEPGILYTAPSFHTPELNNFSTYGYTESFFPDMTSPIPETPLVSSSREMSVAIQPPKNVPLGPYAPPKFHSPTTDHLPQFSIDHHVMPPLWFNATWGVEYKLRERGMRAGVDMHKFMRSELCGADDDIRNLFGGEREIHLVVNWPGYESHRRAYRINLSENKSRYALAKYIANIYRSFINDILAAKVKGSITRYCIGPDDSCGQMLITYSNLYLVGLVCIQLEPPLWCAEVATDGIY